MSGAGPPDAAGGTPPRDAAGARGTRPAAGPTRGAPPAAGPTRGTPPAAGPTRGTPPHAAERPLRLFVALDLPDAVRASLAAVGAAADRDAWRPLPAASLHLTLAFLGSRPPADVDAIAHVLDAEAGGAAPRLSLTAPLLLPPRRPRVLTVALADPDGTLASLQARVSAGLEAAGVFTPEKRPFRAHITVARLRPRARGAPAPDVALDDAPFAAPSLTLYRSQLHPKGARYSPISSVKLSV